MLYLSRPHVARFELGTYEFLRDFIAEHKIPCDWKVVGGVHALFDKESYDAAEKLISLLRQEHPDLAEKVIFARRDASRSLRVPAAWGAVVQTHAAKLWPYKLVAWVLEQLLGEHPADEYNLQTNTPVEHLQRNDGHGGSGWIVHTPRGQVAARHVLLACNAYTSYLLTGMTGLITPVRGQVTALMPPAVGHKPLEHSYVWMRGGGDDDYLIERDEEGDERVLILGGERSGTSGAEEGIWDDGPVNHVVGENLRRALSTAVKLRGDEYEEAERLEAKYEWTGIMGFSKDNYPWVGRVPPSLGGGGGEPGEESHLWISAGYTGHGMPTAARCGIRVAQMMMGKNKSFEMPEEYEMSEERAERAAKMEPIVSRGFVDDAERLLHTLQGRT